MVKIAVLDEKSGIRYNRTLKFGENEIDMIVNFSRNDFRVLQFVNKSKRQATTVCLKNKPDQVLDFLQTLKTNLKLEESKVTYSTDYENIVDAYAGCFERVVKVQSFIDKIPQPWQSDKPKPLPQRMSLDHNMNVQNFPTRNILQQGLTLYHQLVKQETEKLLKQKTADSSDSSSTSEENISKSAMLKQLLKRISRSDIKFCKNCGYDDHVESDCTYCFDCKRNVRGKCCSICDKLIEKLSPDNFKQLNDVLPRFSQLAEKKSPILYSLVKNQIGNEHFDICLNCGGAPFHTLKECRYCFNCNIECEGTTCRVCGSKTPQKRTRLKDENAMKEAKIQVALAFEKYIESQKITHRQIYKGYHKWVDYEKVHKKKKSKKKYKSRSKSRDLSKAEKFKLSTENYIQNL